jgi:hypothetical protein
MSGRGYIRVALTRDDGKFCRVAVHRLVALLWIGPPPEDLPEVNHIDGNKLNNDVSNLEYTDRKGNMQHAKNMGLLSWGSSKRAQGRSPGSRKLTSNQMIAVRMMLDSDHTQREIAERYGISQKLVWLIAQNRTST